MIMKTAPRLWSIPDSYPESLIGEYVRLSSPDRFLFRQGLRLSEDVGLPVVRFAASLNTLLQYACLPNNAMVPLIRNDFGARLSEIAAADVQLINTKVQTQDGESDDFFILNVTSKITGIDKEQSVFSFVPGTEQIMAFKRLAYIESCLGTHMLARDAEYLSHLLVSEELVKVLRAEKVSGVEFLLPSEISW
jgi:hypothetical protein